MTILLVTKLVILLLLPLFLPCVVSAPYEVPCPQKTKYQDQESASRNAPREIQGDTMRNHVSPSHRAVTIAVPLACVSFVLLILLLVKLVYLKQRRLESIHEPPALWEGDEDQKSNGSSGRQPSSVADTHTLATTDLRSMRSHSTPRASRHTSMISSKSGNLSRRCRHSLGGILVGMFGSPDWETSMQREYANHRWRLRREANSQFLGSQQRHTWHSHSQPRNVSLRSHFQNNSMNRTSRQHSREYSSLRIPHVSSFGEFCPDALQRKRRRPRSLNAVIDEINSSQSGSTRSYSPGNFRRPQSHANTPTRSSGFSVMPPSLSHRPSTIREVDTPPATVMLAQEATFHYLVTDFDDGAPLATSAAVYPGSGAFAASGSSETALGSAETVQSSTDVYPNGSRDSSIGGSWRQLPQFPSPPATPCSPVLSTPQVPDAVQVKNVCVQPHYFDERFYNLTVTSSGALGGHGLGYGFHKKVSEGSLAGFSPLTLNIGSPALSDLLVSNLVNPSTAPQSRNQKDDIVSTNPTVNTSSQALLGYSSHGPQQHLTPRSALALNRHHLRVRKHVPFSIVSPPPAYLKASRTTISLGQKPLDCGNAAFPHSSSLVDLTGPVKPSPLRRVVSLGSMVSSRASSRIELKASDISKELKGGSFILMDDADENDLMEDAGARGIDLKPKASNASLFLDLGGLSAGFDEDRSESYSFGVVDNAGQTFDYSQPSSSGIMERVEDCSDEDLEYIVDVHSETFAREQPGDLQN